jgi:hypothetical protein
VGSALAICVVGGEPRSALAALSYKFGTNCSTDSAEKFPALGAGATVTVDGATGAVVATGVAGGEPPSAPAAF